MTTLTISAKNLKPEVNYHSFNKKELNSSFTEKTQNKEVKRGGFILPIIIASNVLLIPNIAFAAETSTILDPSRMTELGMKIATTCVAASVGVASVLMSTAGVYRMLRKKKEATEWTTDIIKGLVQSLVAIPTVYLLYYVATNFFKNILDITKTL